MSVKDYLFPVYCLGCEKEGEWICEDCFKYLTPQGVFCCPVCHSFSSQGACCEPCKGQSFLDGHVAITKYGQDLLIHQVMESLKYSFAEDLSGTIGKMVMSFVNENKSLFSDFDCIVPVPLHKKRFAERGFNQAHIIGQALSLSTGLPLKNILERKIYTRQQAKLNKEARSKNVVDAFVFRSEFVPKRVILVDDVYTTGSTMQECAKIFKENEVKKVSGFSLARG